MDLYFRQNQKIKNWLVLSKKYTRDRIISFFSTKGLSLKGGNYVNSINIIGLLSKR